MWTDVLGPVVGVISLIYLAVQTRTLHKSVKAQAYQAVVNTQISFDALFLQYPSMRQYIYANTKLPDPDTDEGQRARSVVDVALNVIDSTYQQRMLIPKELLASWLDYANSILSRPAVRQYLAENPEWFPEAIDGVLTVGRR